MIERAEFEALIPHKGTMCLLDRVELWDETTIRCLSETHRRSDNPLRRDHRLAAVHLVEYGAQAMAVHCGLYDRKHGRPTGKSGVLVTVRNVQLGVSRVDDIVSPLQINARQLVADANGWLYGFEIKAGGKTLASGRVAVMPHAS